MYQKIAYNYQENAMKHVRNLAINHEEMAKWNNLQKQTFV